MHYLISLFIFPISILAQNYLIPRNQAYQKRSGYNFSYNQGAKVCNWLSYKLTLNDVAGNESFNKVFHKDSLIKVCPSEEMYDGYSFIKGQFKPRSASRNSVSEMNEVNNMLNVVPMDIDFSKRHWRILDNMISGWAVTFDSVFVIKGPIYEKKESETVGSGKIKVPDKFFTVVLVKNGLDLGAIGFILTNKTDLKKIIKCSMPIDSVESKTGYDFFSELPEYLETFVEESIDPNFWKDKSVSYKVKSNYVKRAQCIAVEQSGKRCETETICVTRNCWKHGGDMKSK